MAKFFLQGLKEHWTWLLVLNVMGSEHVTSDKSPVFLKLQSFHL